MIRSMWTSQRGFATAEILVATMVGLLASTAFVKFNHYQIRVAIDQAKQLRLQDMARSAIDIFVREVRRAGQNPTCAGGITPIVSASSSSVRIQADVDGNGVLAATNEDVTYRYNTTSAAFERVTNGVADALVTGVTTTSRFRYYDAVGAELVPSPTLTGTQLNNVRRVHFELSLTTTGVGQNGSNVYGSAAATLKASTATDVDLRNRFFIGAVTCS